MISEDIKIRKLEFEAKTQKLLSRLRAVGLACNQTFLNLGVEFWMFGQ